MTAGFIELLNDSDRELVLRRSRRVMQPAGAVGQGAPDQPVVVERGLARIFVQSAEGRQASVVYLHPGDAFGRLAAFGPPPPVDIQAVTETVVLVLDGENVSRLAELNPRVAQAVMQTIGKEFVHLVRILTVRSLGSMTERLAFDLLERACEAQLQKGELDFVVTHEQLADSIGSTREVVTRIMAQLRRRGILVTSPGHVQVRDATRLSMLVRGLLVK
jgi:CRP/FNR family transcriptional regulator